MDSIKNLLQVAKSCIQGMEQASGEVLYSAMETLQPSQIYLLGLNPGGNPELHANETIENSLSKLPSKVTNNYLHDSWAKFQPGEAPLQKRVVGLLKALGYDPGSVPASNLIFRRTLGANDLDFSGLSPTLGPTEKFGFGLMGL